MLVHPLLISGKQGSGKSKTSDKLQALLEYHGYPVVRYKFAAVIYELHDMILAHMAELGFEVPVKDGRLLQLLGTDWGRTTFGDHVWVKCASYKYQELRKEAPLSLFSEKPLIMLIDDLRFKTEFEAFREDGYTVRLEADRDVRKARAESWRENENHLSEVDLDDSLDDFDMLLSTSGSMGGVSEIAHHIMANFLGFISNINA